jgi:hypothetical protein
MQCLLFTLSLMHLCFMFHVEFLYSYFNHFWPQLAFLKYCPAILLPVSDLWKLCIVLQDHDVDTMSQNQ